MPRIEDAVVECERIAADDRYYYSQPDRMKQFGRDCSSLIGRALDEAGFDYPSDWSPATYEMKGYLEAIGFVWHAGTANVHRGCILWKKGHTAMATSRTDLVEAWCDENYGIGPGSKPGDQTGWEIRTAPIGWTTWEGYWEYPDELEEDVISDADIEKIAEKVADKVIMGTPIDGINLYNRILGIDNLTQGNYEEIHRTDDPSGRGVIMKLHDHFKWVADAVQTCLTYLKAIAAKVGADVESE